MDKELEIGKLTPAEEQNDAVPSVVRSCVLYQGSGDRNARGRRIAIFHHDAAIGRVRLARDGDVWIDLEPGELLGHKWFRGSWSGVEGKLNENWGPYLHMARPRLLKPERTDKRLFSSWGSQTPPVVSLRTHGTNQGAHDNLGGSGDVGT